MVLFLSYILAGNNLSAPSDDSNDHCNKTVDIYEDVASPELTNLNRHRPMTCWYRFRSFRGAPRDWVLRLRFKKFKVGTLLNATHCDGGYLQVNNMTFIRDIFCLPINYNFKRKNKVWQFFLLLPLSSLSIKKPHPNCFNLHSKIISFLQFLILMKSHYIHFSLWWLKVLVNFFWNISLKIFN